MCPAPKFYRRNLQTESVHLQVNQTPTSHLSNTDSSRGLLCNPERILTLVNPLLGLHQMMKGLNSLRWVKSFAFLKQNLHYKENFCVN